MPARRTHRFTPAPPATAFAASSDAILEGLFANGSLGLCLVDPEGRVCRVNGCWLDTVQLAREDVAGRAIWDLFPESAPELRALYGRARAGEVVDVPGHRQLLRGRETWVAGRLSPVPFPAGTGVLVTTWDDTAARRAERASEARARAVMENVGDHLVVLEAVRDGAGAVVDWRYVDANDRALELLGAGRELVGRTVREVLAGRADARHADLLRVLETGERVRYEASYGGRILLVTLFRADPQRVASASVDITERKRAEERAEFVARFPEENPDPVLRLSPDLVVVYANPAARARLGALGLLPGAPAPAPIVETARRVLAERRRLRTEVECDGAAFSMNFTPVGAEVNVYAQDVTDRRAAEAALRAANERLKEADRRKDEFLAMLSHELRNPLAPIRNAVAILGHASATGEQAARAKAVIGRQVAHLTRLVDDLLDVTRIARGKIELRREPLDLVPLVRRAAEDHRPLLYERGVSLGVELPAAGAWVRGDATRLTQVFGNLLQNAAKFTERGGRVTVALRAGEGAVEVRVTDDGVGLEPDLIDRVFEPFVQADTSLARTQGGLGLGLALVKRITEKHGGTVAVESAGPGLGAAFVVRLPASSAPDAGAQVDAGTRRAARRRILVVDDNRDAAESLAEVLAMLGHDADVAYDGPSAVESARSSPPDVVLCDIGLPGMSGYEVARQLRAIHPGALKLFAVSGYARPEDVERAHEAGFDGHVAKPPDPDLLVRLLEA